MKERASCFRCPVKGPKHMSERILVVDDTPMNIDLMEGILTPVGYTVDSAKNGEEALGKVANDTPDLILLDVMMPEMNGYEVCRRIRENKSLPYIPIIYITASELEQKTSQRAWMQAGMTIFANRSM